MIQKFLQNRINAFHRLGLLIWGMEPDKELQAEFDAQLKEAVKESLAKNEWFTQALIQYALNAIATQMLDKAKLEVWIKRYSTTSLNRLHRLRPSVGVIAAGNLPLVGFYDVLCVLMSGAKLKLKVSSKDAFLIPFLIRFMGSYMPDILKDVEFYSTPELGEIIAILGTGSDENTEKMAARWKDVPCLLRKSRTSVGVLFGHESELELVGMLRDVCLYYGLGCRNINTLFLPVDYPLEKLTTAFAQALEDPDLWMQHSEYQNIIRITKARYQLLNTSFTDASSVLLVPSSALFAPVATVYYVYFKDEQDLHLQLDAFHHRIQVVVSSYPDLFRGRMSTTLWGQAQHPRLEDAPDGLDPIEFLLQLASSLKM